MTPTHPAAVVILAAGGGTRMRSATPKVLHTIGGRTLLGHALATARSLAPQHVVVVVRRERDRVAAHVADVDPDATLADQDEVAGTGRAAECGLRALPAHLTGTIVVTMGDVPLLTAATLQQLLDRHVEGGAAMTLATAQLPDPTGYGRVLYDETGSVRGIIEERDATDEQRSLTEVNAGIYAFDVSSLRAALAQIGTDNAQREKYLTDSVAVLRAGGARVLAHPVDDRWETEGVNDRVQLARLGAELNRRVVEHWMRAGVTVVDPATTWVDVDVTLGRDVTIRPQTQLLGACTIGDDVVIGPDTTLTDVEVGRGASVVRTQATLALIGDGASVGPYAHLRPGTELGARGKIGEFVGTKNAVIGDGAKVPHLSYVGDADIGEGTNIGAGTIFANYDGVAKHHTTVGAQCRTGANNTFVAPVTIGDGAATGAGTVVRRTVPPGSLAVSTGPQRVVSDWVRRRRPGTPAHRAAERALDAAASQESP
ncbi:MAG: bifunctional UDP-N-acetylglucosamine diphosphorylase/glucosamine-1-phosphate N-acetyltransferase GlmU [Nocardioidaceae bacterium]